MTFAPPPGLELLTTIILLGWIAAYAVSLMVCGAFFVRWPRVGLAMFGALVGLSALLASFGYFVEATPFVFAAVLVAAGITTRVYQRIAPR